MKKYDIIVVGGGFAGVTAALSAAREGSRVLLVEKGNALGGAAVHALVNPFMSTRVRCTQDPNPFYKGLFEKILARLYERNATGPVGRSSLSFLEEELKYILNEMMFEAGVDLLFHAYIFSVKKDGSLIQSISVATKEGAITLDADYFVDATGDAQLAYLAGCPTVLGREPDHLCQPMTLCFRLGNVDVEKFFASKERLELAYKKALGEGTLINPREDILVFRTPIHNVLHFNTTRVVKLDPTNACDVTKAELIARKQVFEIYDFMKEHADGLEDSFLMMTAPEIGVRESRMIIGDHVLTEEECRNCTVFDDAISACNYDIDIHNPEGSGTSHYYFPDGTFYTIPYRSLIPQTVENLLVAGRCISSNHGAQASYRIMPSVCCIGEAAGTAIALAAKSQCSVREIDIAHLQNTLKAHGAFIGK